MRPTTVTVSSSQGIEFMRRRIDLLRWATILPGAIAGGVTGWFVLHWLLLLLFPSDGRRFLDFIEFPGRLDIERIELALAPFVFTVFSISIGAEISPTYKLRVAIALSAIWLMIAGYMFWSSQGQDTFEAKTFGGGLGLLVGPTLIWFREKRRGAIAASVEHQSIKSDRHFRDGSGFK
jgi:hypothetical protein